MAGDYLKDTIYREDALDATRKLTSIVGGSYISKGDMQSILMQLPSAEPKTGRWIRNFDGNEWYWYCSSCKEQWYEEDLWMGGNEFPKFCPNCGSKMEWKNETT